VEKLVFYLLTKSHITSPRSSLVIAIEHRENKISHGRHLVTLQSTKESPGQLPDISGASVALDSQFYEVAMLLLATEKA
jgi:hypothetical protein